MAYIERKEVCPKVMVQKRSVVLWGTRLGFLVFFLVGIIIANLWFVGSGVEWNIISESALLDTGGWRQEYLCLYIFIKRLPILILLIFFSRHRWKVLCYSAVAAWQGFALGYLAAENILNIGIGGLWYYLQILLPHYFVYAAVFWLLLHRESKENGQYQQNRMAKAAGTILVIVLFAVGVVLESYMNRLFLT